MNASRPRHEGLRATASTRIPTATVGYGCLVLALLLAVWGMVAPLLWGQTGRQGFFTATLGAIVGQFALVTLAGLALAYAFVTTDFSVKYVAVNTTLATPIYYRVTGLWGAHWRDRSFSGSGSSSSSPRSLPGSIGSASASSFLGYSWSSPGSPCSSSG